MRNVPTGERDGCKRIYQTWMLINDMRLDAPITHFRLYRVEYSGVSSVFRSVINVYVCV